MDISTYLLHSKNNRTADEKYWQKLVSENGEEELVNVLCDSSNAKLSNRAAYLFMVAVDTGKELFLPYQNKLIETLLNQDKPEAVRRTIMRWLQEVPIIDEDLQGAVFEESLHWIESRKTPIAMRAYAMTVATNMAIDNPPLIPELLDLLENVQYQNYSPGVNSRVAREINRLKN